MKRLPAIDLHRGLAVVLMVMHHVLDSWTHAPDRAGPLWKALRHLGGIPAPAFLVLAGLSAALLAARARDKGIPARTRSLDAVKRGLYVLGIAFAFRLFAFTAGRNPWSRWEDLFRVDILNCMGVALVLVGGLGALASSRRGSITVASLLGAAFVLPAPFVFGRALTWPSALAGAYVSGAEPRSLFPLFPWLGFAASGWVLGEVVASVARDPDPAAERRFGVRALLAGVLLFVGPWALDAFVPVKLYPDHAWWKAGPTYVAMRFGIEVGILGLAFLAVRFVSTAPARGLLLLGRHSLFVYVVHLELAYGILAGPVRKALPLWGAGVGVALLVVACGLACLALERRPARPAPA